MKQYPSIPGAGRRLGINLHTFDKLDGSNLRFEWSKKRGWYKFGTRRRMFDETDDQFGDAYPLFFDTLAEPLERIVVDKRWPKVVVFAEYWGSGSFAGYHEEGDEKFLTVIDVSPHQKGILPPKEFLNLFGEFGPNYLGHIRWNADFIRKVEESKVDGITFEGVVGKALKKKEVIMYKAKTKAWRSRVMTRFGSSKGQEIINS